MRVSREEKKKTAEAMEESFDYQTCWQIVRYNFLVYRLRVLWQVKSAMEVIDVVNDAYIFRLASDVKHERS